MNSEGMITLKTVDLAIIAIYFLAVLAIGFYLKRFAQTGKDFFLAGREMTAWVAGLSFVSANLGSLELLGWAGSSYQYGILAALGESLEVETDGQDREEIRRDDDEVDRTERHDSSGIHGFVFR